MKNEAKVIDHPNIAGGEFPVGELKKFLKAWKDPLKTMPFRIWEQTDGITFGRDDEAPEKTEWLERGRLFGEGGDLSVRRDGERFLWWYIGGHQPDPSYMKDDSDYWRAAGEAEKTLNREEVDLLLWGKGKPATETGHEAWQWFDDRVAHADLSYPIKEEFEQVFVQAHIYSRAGRVEFVWFYGLVGIPAKTQKES